MLVASGMGGMDEMSIFCERLLLHILALVKVTLTLLSADDHCLESLYPPGMCVSGRNRSRDPGL